MSSKFYRNIGWKEWFHTRNVVSEACPMSEESDQLSCSSKDPSSPSLSDSQAHLEFFHLCYCCKVPCQKNFITNCDSMTNKKTGQGFNKSLF
jgi:hypothetical protein